MSAPAFNKAYIFYRFIDKDDHIKDLKVGDIYIEKGFTSTTRDPFYRSDVYEFGFILVKIRIPKHKKGVGLSLELLSHFPREEEIILPPFAKLRLKSRDEECDYFHPNVEYASRIKRKYEFEWIENGAVEFPERPLYTKTTNLVDFLQISLLHGNLNDKIRKLVDTYFDPMNKIQCKIGSTTFDVIGEKYDSTGAYKHLYSITTQNGFCMYALYEGYIAFMIEIGGDDGNEKVRVNYINRYTHSKYNPVVDSSEFLQFIAEISHAFEIYDVAIYAEYVGCNIPANPMRDNENIRLYADEYHKNQRLFSKENQLDAEEEYIGGAYCVDFYRYLKEGWKRYANTDVLAVELQPKFLYANLDELKLLSPLMILRKEDRDEIFQIYMKNYKPLHSDEDDNLAKFYIWIANNMCYLMGIFTEKFERYFRIANPFKGDMYILDTMTYLYNRNYAKVYNRHIKIDRDENRSSYNLPKNEYRVKRELAE